MNILNLLGANKHQKLILRLEYDHHEIQRLEVWNHDESEITIGRDADKCTWALPEDGNVSKVHARISFRNTKPIICDLGSTNGTFCKGRQLKSPKEFPLRPGDEIEFGDSGKSKLFVEQDRRHDDTKAAEGNKKLDRPCAWLKSRIRTYPVDYNELIIGSSGECHLSLPNKRGYISGKHAILKNVNGTFTITDISKNGTRVDGQQIAKDLGYPLRDGDVINIGGFELTLLLHEESSPISMEKMLFYTVLAAILLWIGYIAVIKVMTLAPEKLYHQAEIAKNKGEYAKAKHSLDKAKARTDDRELLNAIGKMLQLIENIEATRKSWEDCKAKLSLDDIDEKTLQEVSFFLKDMDARPQYWTWVKPPADKSSEPVPLGALERSKAEIVKKLLDANDKATRMLNMHPVQKSDIVSLIETLDGIRLNDDGYDEPYIKKINDRLISFLSILRNWEDNYSKLEGIMKSLQKYQTMAQDWNRLAIKLERNELDMSEAKKSMSMMPQVDMEDLKRRNYREIIIHAPDYDDIITNIDNIASDLKETKEKAFEVIKSNTSMLRPSIVSLKNETERVKELDTWAAQKKFNDIKEFHLSFDSNAEWGHVSELKTALENYVKNCMKKDVEAISYIYNELEADNNKHLDEDLKQFENEQTKARVLNCDCFGFPFPNKNRNTPCGKYDELLGIEYFYSYLKDLDPRKPNTRLSVDMLNFKPRIRTLFDGMRKIETCLQNLNVNYVPHIEWLNKNEAKKTRDDCQRLIDRKKSIIDKMLAIDAPSTSRAYLISRGIALYLSSDSSSIELKNDVIRAVKAYRNSINAIMAEKYDNVSFSSRIKNRKEILKFGMPGDGVIRELWLDENTEH